MCEPIDKKNSIEAEKINYEKLAPDGLQIMIKEQGEMMDKLLKKQALHTKINIIIAVSVILAIIIGVYVLWRIDDNNLIGQVLYYVKLARETCGTPLAWS